jgi:hypothetical protein
VNEYLGIFKLLAITPVWAIALFMFAVCSPLGIMFVLADRRTGLFFNVSYSGMIGDMLLTIAILIGVTVLQRGTVLPGWAGNIPLQFSWTVFCCVTATRIMFKKRTFPLPTDTAPDFYHNLIVFPIYMFLVPIALIIIWNGGTLPEITFGFGFVVIWATLAIGDYETGRLGQPRYVSCHFGLAFRNGRIRGR